MSWDSVCGSKRVGGGQGLKRLVDWNRAAILNAFGPLLLNLGFFGWLGLNVI